jgi:hypothetical protein
MNLSLYVCSNMHLHNIKKLYEPHGLWYSSTTNAYAVDVLPYKRISFRMLSIQDCLLRVTTPKTSCQRVAGYTIFIHLLAILFLDVVPINPENYNGKVPAVQLHDRIMYLWWNCKLYLFFGCLQVHMITICRGMYTLRRGGTRNTSPLSA